jgi:FkbM family methyltransferase
MQSDLIYDVGLHVGRDTDFYLQKGFRVVAIEANPRLAEAARKKFESAVSSGQLHVLNVAIHDHEGTTTLYVNDEKDDWSTVVPEAMQVKAFHSSTFHPVEVPCTRFESILAEHGMPYYLKVDIEGADLLCLSALHALDDRPKYTSVEVSAEEPYRELAHLRALGYREFKLVNQALNHTIALPKPALEGKYVPFQFDGHSSGPFGEESPGGWLDFEQAVDQLRVTLADYADDRHEPQGLAKSLVRRWRSGRRANPPDSWHDLHAR